MKEIFILDDHEIVIKGLASFIDGLSGYKFAGSACTLDLGLKRILHSKPDVVILDYAFPEGNGGSIIQAILHNDPHCKIVVFSFNSSQNIVQNLLALGASGYILKGDGIEELKACLSEISQDNTYTSSSIKNDTSPNSSAELSSREKEVAYLIQQGLSTKQIASELIISFNTVESHRRSIRKKLRAHNVAEMLNSLNQSNT